MVRPECQSILDDISDLRSEVVQFQQDLNAADTYKQMQDAAKEIKKLNAQIAQRQSDFDKCEGNPPLPGPIGALFPSRVSVATNNSTFRTLGAPSAAAGMFFSQADYSSVAFSFPSTDMGTFPFGFIPVSNTLSAKLSLSPASGSFERSTGHVDIPSATFLVHHSFPLIVDSTVVFTPLTTRTVPSSLSLVGSLTGLPLDRSASPGRVVLVGSSTLVGGNFGGTVVDMIIDGILSQFPPP